MKMVCNMCPRKCNVLRDDEENVGYCKMPYSPKISNYSLHKWEEPCISSGEGSGTIFFTGCNLKCCYCQNFDISHKNIGKEITIERLKEIIDELISFGANNINFVNPTHYVHIIKKILEEKKYSVPIIYNSSGYESVETLKTLEGLIDVYLPDLKYFDDTLAIKYSNAPNYFLVATNAIKEMYRQTRWMQIQ